MSWHVVEVRSVEHYLVEVEEGECPEEVVQETMFSKDWDEMETLEEIRESEVTHTKSIFPKGKILEL